MNEELSKLIKEKRESNNLSQRELARKINIDNATLSRIEKGLVKKPDFEILFKISRELKIDLVNLLKLANYSDMEMLVKLSKIDAFYDQTYLIEKVDESKINKVLIAKNNEVFIDVRKVLNCYKNNEITAEEAIRLINACIPFDDGKDIIYICEDGDIILDYPFID